MRTTALLLGGALLAAPLAAPDAALAADPSGTSAAGLTQSRDGTGNAAHPGNPSNSLPAGAVNANTGPQSQPAYPSGSSTPNPGAAFAGTTPQSATGPAAGSAGSLSTTTVTPGGGAVRRSGTPGVGEEGAGQPQAPRR